MYMFQLTIMNLSTVFLMLSIRYVVGVLEINDAESNSRNSISECVMEIANREFNFGEIITMVLPQTQPQTGKPSKTTVTERPLLRNLLAAYKWTLLTRKASEAAVPTTFTKKSHHYIITIKKAWELNSTLAYLRDVAWNPHAKFIIVTNNKFQQSPSVVTEIMKALWASKALNAIFLLPQTPNSSVLDIYTWFPFEGENCANQFNESQLINRCTNGIFESNTKIFLEKVPDDLHGCPIRVRAIVWPPYVIAPPEFSRSEIGINFTSGLEILLLNTVAEKMNATLIYTVSAKILDWGSISTVGNSTGLFYELMMENVDIGVGAVAATNKRYINFDYTISYTSESITWCVPRALIKPKWLSVFNILTPISWVYVGITYVTVAFFTWAVAYWYGYECSSYKSLSSSFLSTLAVLISVSVEAKPRVHTVQMMFILWCMFSLNLTVVYQTYLINFLVNPSYEAQISTIEDIFAAKIPFGYLHVSRFYFGKSDDWLQKKLTNDAVICYDTDVCMNDVARHRNYTFAVPRQFLMYVQNKFLDHDGRSLLYGFKQDYIFYPVTMYTYKGYPLLNRINEVLSSVRQTGIQSKWESDLQQMTKNKSDIDTLNDKDGNVEVLTLVQLHGAFIVFAFGIGFAVLAFLIEVIVSNMKTRNVRNKNIK